VATRRLIGSKGNSSNMTISVLVPEAHSFRGHIFVRAKARPTVIRTQVNVAGAGRCGLARALG